MRAKTRAVVSESDGSLEVLPVLEDEDEFLGSPPEGVQVPAAEATAPQDFAGDFDLSGQDQGESHRAAEPEEDLDDMRTAERPAASLALIHAAALAQRARQVAQAPARSPSASLSSVAAAMRAPMALEFDDPTLVQRPSAPPSESPSLLLTRRRTEPSIERCAETHSVPPMAMDSATDAFHLDDEAMAGMRWDAPSPAADAVPEEIQPVAPPPPARRGRVAAQACIAAAAVMGLLIGGVVTARSRSPLASKAPTNSVQGSSQVAEAHTKEEKTATPTPPVAPVETRPAQPSPDGDAPLTLSLDELPTVRSPQTSKIADNKLAPVPAADADAAKTEAAKATDAAAKAGAKAEGTKADAAKAADPVKADAKADAKAEAAPEAAKAEAKAGEAGAKVGDEAAPKVESEPALPAFDQGAASAAIGQAAAGLGACRLPDGRGGPARVIVTFAPSGRVTQAVISGGVFAGTAAGGCIASKLRAATVAAFAGPAVSVSKTVQVPGE